MKWFCFLAIGLFFQSCQRLRREGLPVNERNYKALIDTDESSNFLLTDAIIAPFTLTASSIADSITLFTEKVMGTDCRKALEKTSLRSMLSEHLCEMKEDFLRGRYQMDDINMLSKADKEEYLKHDTITGLKNFDNFIWLANPLEFTAQLGSYVLKVSIKRSASPDWRLIGQYKFVAKKGSSVSRIYKNGYAQNCTIHIYLEIFEMETGKTEFYSRALSDSCVIYTISDIEIQKRLSDLNNDHR
ncbi:MAG: hypothetical protein NTW29_02325 [Bacteroidetes bacterium]|nr:hypothetical protein [Bacteroidota bacterium]